VLDTLDPQYALGKLADLVTAPAQHDDLQAIVRVEMYMHGGDDLGMVVVLYVVELALQVRGVVVEDKGQRADYLGEGVLPLLVDQGLSDEVAYDLGAVLGEPASRDQVVELHDQFLGDGNAETYQFTHDLHETDGDVCS